MSIQILSLEFTSLLRAKVASELCKKIYILHIWPDPPRRCLDLCSQISALYTTMWVCVRCVWWTAPSGQNTLTPIIVISSVTSRNSRPFSPAGILACQNLQIFLTALRMALFHFRVPVGHGSLTLSQHAQSQDPETKAAKWNSDLINFIICTCPRSAVTRQNVLCETTCLLSLLCWCAGPLISAVFCSSGSCSVSEVQSLLSRNLCRCTQMPGLHRNCKHADLAGTSAGSPRVLRAVKSHILLTFFLQTSRESSLDFTYLITHTPVEYGCEVVKFSMNVLNNDFITHYLNRVG